MALTISEGDMFAEPVSEMLTDSNNCMGVSGAGLALAFKRRFPEYQRAYAQACIQGEIQLGKIWVYETGSMLPPRWIVSFPTIHHWRDTADAANIEQGLRDYRRVIEELSPASVSVPALGCGIAGGDWTEIKELIAEHLSDLEADVRVFQPK